MLLHIFIIVICVVNTLKKTEIKKIREKVLSYNVHVQE